MDELQDFLDAVQELDDKTCCIVEGKNDLLALEEQGVDNIVVLSDQLYLMAEEIACHYKKAVILTDLDKEGKKLYATLKKYLTRMGVHINDGPRELLFRTKLSHVEGLSRHLQRLMR